MLQGAPASLKRSASPMAGRSFRATCRLRSTARSLNGVANWDGSISLDPRLQRPLGEMLDELASGNVANAPSLKQQAIGTLVHESLHQTGRLRPLAYDGGGAVVEEVATDMAARKI